MEENSTENFIPVSKPQTSPILTEQAQYYLQTAANWAKFLAIIGFVVCGIMVLIGLFASIFSASILSSSPYYPTMRAFLAFGGTSYIIIAAVFFMPCLYIYQFSSNAKKGILLSNSTNISASLGKLKSAFKFCGIMTIAIFSIYALITIAFIAGIGAYALDINIK